MDLRLAEHGSQTPAFRKSTEPLVGRTASFWISRTVNGISTDCIKRAGWCSLDPHQTFKSGWVPCGIGFFARRAGEMTPCPLALHSFLDPRVCPGHQLSGQRRLCPLTSSLPEIALSVGHKWSTGSETWGLSLAAPPPCGEAGPCAVYQRASWWAGPLVSIQGKAPGT